MAEQAQSKASGLAVNDATPLIVPHIQQLDLQQSLDLSAHHAAVDRAGQLQIHQGIIEGEPLGTGPSGQQKQLALERHGHLLALRLGQRRKGILQQGTLVCLLDQIGDEQQIGQLAKAAQTQGEQPEETGEGPAVIETLQATHPEYGSPPEQIAHRQGAGFLRQQARAVGLPEAATPRPAQTLCHRSAERAAQGVGMGAGREAHRQPWPTPG